jgi:hypothetical protein
MKLNVNRHMLTKTDWDSGSISPLAAVLHLFQETGRFQGTVLQGTEPVSRFSLVVDEQAPEAPVNIDLEAVDQSAFMVNPGKYTVFQAPRGRGGYSVVVRRSDDERRAVAFDNRELGSEDIFVAVLLRPGRYAITNQVGTKGYVTVTPPQKKERIRHIPQPRKGVVRYVAPEALTIECTDKEFRPDSINTESGQSLLFVIKKPQSRIKIEQEKPG